MVEEPELVEMAHGDGGRATRELIDRLFRPAFGEEHLSASDDAAPIAELSGEWMVSTDTFVVSPSEFPGGDVGKLAVCGTVNDLAACGARPVFLTAGFVLEEGLSLQLLRRVVRSMASTASADGVRLVAADTKVVGRGSGDGVYINTTGLGQTMPGVELDAARIVPGDRIIATGYVGDHGMAVLTHREGFPFSVPVTSDCASLWPAVETMLSDAGDAVKFMRDPTRGGIATALKEIAEQVPVDVILKEEDIPVRDPVRSAADMLGLDPLYLANEGNLLIVVHEDAGERVVSSLRSRRGVTAPRVIGEVVEGSGAVRAVTSLGGTRDLGLFAGDPLPRIC